MVRLMLVLAPIMCILAGIGVNSILISFMKNLDSVTGHNAKHEKKEKDRNYPYKNEVLILYNLKIFVIPSISQNSGFALFFSI